MSVAEFAIDTLNEYTRPGESVRVLVVEDDRVTNRLLSRWLRSRGCVVRSASSGEEALSAIHEQVPEVVLLDVGLPGISGLEVLGWIRQQDIEVVVIMITASDTPETAITALRNRADDYLRKPIVWDECEAIISRTVRRLYLQRQNNLLQMQLDEKRRQLETELARAAQVQMGLLPRETPSLPGFELAACCLPAREVGGDFYDWSCQNPEVLHITVGDVMGKGMPAALLMATARATLNAVASQNQPAAAVALAAQVLNRDLDHSESFVTLFHAQVNLPMRCVSYVDAGHGHVFVRRADGSTAEMPVGDVPLGVLPGTVYQEGHCRLEAGDALIIYSDGLSDVRPALVADRPRLSACLDGATSAQAMVDRLVALVDQAHPLPDDLTVVVLRCVG